MTSVREDIMAALREYEEEERKRRQRELREKEEKIRQEIEKKKQEKEEETIQSFYEHLKEPKIEGYFNTPYCDSEGKNTVGAGVRIPNYDKVKDLTMTSKNEAVSENNPAWDEVQKKDFMRKLDAFCDNKENWRKNPIKQIDDYSQTYGETMPYFQDHELEELSKNYIRNTALPEVKKNLSNVRVNFYQDLNQNGRNGFLDLQYNLGGNKFKLMDLEDPQQIGQSNLRYKNELMENPMRYQEPAIRQDLSKQGIWPGLSLATKRRDTEAMMQNAHRRGVSADRNEKVQNYLRNPWHHDDEDDWWHW